MNETASYCPHAAPGGCHGAGALLGCGHCRGAGAMPGAQAGAQDGGAAAEGHGVCGRGRGTGARCGGAAAAHEDGGDILSWVVVEVQRLVLERPLVVVAARDAGGVEDVRDAVRLKKLQVARRRVRTQEHGLGDL
eukprot:4374670-Prymnesium_polylepis.1